MDSNKQLNDLDLLKLLEETPEQNLIVKDPIIKFINFYQIDPGQDKVKGSFLYLVFKNYIKSSISQTQFENALSLTLVKKSNYYYIDKANSKLSNFLNQYENDSLKFKTYNQLIVDFITDCKINTGKKLKVSKEQLYNLFTLYKTKINNKRNINIDNFDIIIQNLLNPIISKGENVYLLDDSMMSYFTEMEFQHAKEGKKVKQKKPRKIP